MKANLKSIQTKNGAVLVYTSGKKRGQILDYQSLKLGDILYIDGVEYVVDKN